MLKHLFIFSFCLGLALFSGCKDDYQEYRDDPFENYAADYSADKLVLTFNGKEMTGKTVSFHSTDHENSSTVLKQMIPGEDSLVIKNGTFEWKGSENFSFEGENTTADRTIHLKGEARNGVLSLNTTFKITSEVVGNWALSETNEKDKLNTAGFYLDLATTAVNSVTLPIMLYNGNQDENHRPIYDCPHIVPARDTVILGDTISVGFASHIIAQSFFVSRILPGLELKENGYLTATYRSEFGGEPTTSKEESIRYNVKDNHIYLLIESWTEKNDVTQPDRNKMLRRGIPLKLEIRDNQMKVHADKEMLIPFTTFTPLLDLIKDFIIKQPKQGEVTDESLHQFLDHELVNLITTADKFDLGLNLVRTGFPPRALIFFRGVV